MDRQTWIAACAHQLQRRWKTVDPEQLEEVAGDLWGDILLRTMTPSRAADEWLEPVTANGMLGRLSADEISAGGAGLADAPDGTETRVEIVTEMFGRVLVTYRRQSGLHRGKRTHAFWTACHAEVMR